MSDLPEGWTEATLDEACRKVTDGTHHSPKEQYDAPAEGLYKYVTAKNIRSWGLDLEDLTYVTERVHREIYNRCAPELGDVLLTKDGVNAGDVAMNTLDEEFSLLSSVALLKPERDLLDSGFLRYYINSFEGQRRLIGNMRGAAIRRIILRSIKTASVPLPPLAEQKRIVLKIEELFSELDAGEESLRRARRQLGVYRQSLLKQAFEGKLTAPWRAQHPDILESPDQLLTRIQSERQAIHEQRLEDWEQEVLEWEEAGKKGKRPSKPRASKKVQDLHADVRSTLAELPTQWFWAALGLMSSGVEYGTAAKSKKDGECPVIRMGNLQRGEIDWGDLVFTSDADEITKYQLSAGDVLFNRTNSPELVGKTAIYRGSRPAVFAGYLIRVNQIASTVDSGFLNYFLNSHTAKQYGNTVKTDGVNQSNINGEKLCGYPFPFCSLPEQQEIVRLLDEQFEVIEQNEREIDAALKRSEALRQSILKKAFTGHLVPQDPTDEPASTLLTRIRAERVEAEKLAKSNKKAAKKKTSRKRAKKS